MTILTEPAPVPQPPPVAVVGIDTHRDTHTLVMLSLIGVVLGSVVIENSTAGYRAAIAWIRTLTPGLVRIGMEGTRSYGLNLMRALTSNGFTVLEVEQPTRSRRRGKGKTDLIDAELAARTVLAGKGHQPRCDGDREALRILTTARNAMTTTHTAMTNQLKDLLRAGTDDDRALARRGLTTNRLTPLSQLTTTPEQDLLTRTRINEIVRLATALTVLDRDLKANHQELDKIITAGRHQSLLDLFGVGPVVAATLIIGWSHPGRCRNNAAFAALAGVNPIPASSGNTTRHRINRGGDRTLNRALHTIVLTRIRSDERTLAYIDKRRAQGKDDRDIRPILKRYVAREIFNLLQATA